MVSIRYLFFRTMSLHVFKISHSLQNPWENECSYSITMRMTILRKWFSIPMSIKVLTKFGMSEYFYNPTAIWYFTHIKNLKNISKIQSILFHINKRLIYFLSWGRSFCQIPIPLKIYWTQECIHQWQPKHTAFFKMHRAENQVSFASGSILAIL